jgi:hypothetical protein
MTETIVTSYQNHSHGEFTTGKAPVRVKAQAAMPTSLRLIGYIIPYQNRGEELL